MKEVNVTRVLILTLLSGLLLIPTGLTAQVKVKPVGQLQVHKDLKLKLPDLKVSIRPQLMRRRKPDFHKFAGAMTAYPGQELGRRIKVGIKNIGNMAANNFFVDLVLSSDTHIPVKLAAYSPNFQEDVLLKGGRESVSTLAAGGFISLKLNGTNTIPSNTPPGLYYLGVVVDPGKKVTEKNENNNTAFLKLQIVVRIEKVSQTGYWPGASGSVELNLRGQGFGATIGSKVVRVGAYSFDVNDLEYWTDQYAIICLPNSFPFGEYYDIYLMKGGQIISNRIKRHLIKMDLEGSLFTDAQGHTIDARAPAGATIGLDGVFSTSQGNRRVRFGSTNANVLSWGLSLIRVVVPNLAPGTVDVYIERNGLAISNKAPFLILPN
jgi:hypothetical protein